MKIVDVEPIIKKLYKIGNEKDKSGEHEFALGIDTVIYLLEQAKTVDAVSIAAYKQVAWERDLAIHQLSQYGVELGQGKDDDLVRVTRCKDCMYYNEDNMQQHSGWCECLERGEYNEHFCSYGEPKEGRENDSEGSNRGY